MRFPHAPWIASLALLAAGCTTLRTTDPPRTATEQLLVSTAADRAAEELDFRPLDGKKVFLDATYLEAPDKGDRGYAAGIVAGRLNAAGAGLVGERKDAEAVVLVESGALSVNRRETLIGLPAIPIPVPGVGVFETPELALFKRVNQTGIAKLAAGAHATATGAQLLPARPVAGKSAVNDWKLLFFLSFRTTTIPELK